MKSFDLFIVGTLALLLLAASRVRASVDTSTMWFDPTDNTWKLLDAAPAYDVSDARRLP